MVYLVALILLVASTASFTRLATEDDVAAPWRVNLREKYGDMNFWVRALECFRCTAVWVALPLTLLALLIFGYALDLHWIWWLILAATWIPVSKAVAYLAFVLYIRGEA